MKEKQLIRNQRRKISKPYLMFCHSSVLLKTKAKSFLEFRLITNLWDMLLIPLLIGMRWKKMILYLPIVSLVRKSNKRRSLSRTKRVNPMKYTRILIIAGLKIRELIRANILFAKQWLTRIFTKNMRSFRNLEGTSWREEVLRLIRLLNS